MRIFSKKTALVPFFVAIIFFGWTKMRGNGFEPTNGGDENIVDQQEVVTEKKDRIVELLIESGSTFSVIMEEGGVSGTDVVNIFDASQDVYDLSNIREGRKIFLTYDAKTDDFKHLMYPISSEEELYIVRSFSSQKILGASEVDEVTGHESPVSPESSRGGPVTGEDGNEGEDVNPWTAERKEIIYEVEIEKAGGIIETSLYESGLAQNIKEGTIIELANAFQWTIDFSYDVRSGDEYAFIYEKRYRDGVYAHDGRVLASHFKNNGVNYQVYYFEESEENKGYFDENGNSVQKIFLKAPVAFKYISSGFTYGQRYIRAFDTFTGHKAIDYAAAYGTPIRSVGDGTVTSAGWNSQGYGRLTKIRHNATYSTNYAHQSRIIVSPGQRVKQGEVIGYVGSSGFSTGPHVHFELVKNGAKVNPLIEILPPGEPIKEENTVRFEETIQMYLEMLK